ncbi:MAG: hypothetical protein GY701_19515 [Sulfitobacter sp.]|nr:hypothetical protein [Sulfitobacter sp.]
MILSCLFAVAMVYVLDWTRHITDDELTAMLDTIAWRLLGVASVLVFVTFAVAAFR